MSYLRAGSRHDKGDPGDGVGLGLANLLGRSWANFMVAG